MAGFLDHSGGADTVSNEDGPRPEEPAGTTDRTRIHQGRQTP